MSNCSVAATVHKSQKCIEIRILQNHVFCTNEIITYFFFSLYYEREELGEK
jgi:hypothetical protein